jgi:hypothetical protein
MNNSSKTTSSTNKGTVMMTSLGFGVVVAIFIITVGVMTGMISVNYNNSKNDSTSYTNNDVKQQNVRGMLDMEKQSMGKLVRERKEFDSLRQQNTELENELKKMKKLIADQKQAAKTTMTDQHGGDTTSMGQLQNRIQRFIQSTQRLKDMIQLISKHHLIEKYGKGPHYVEILLSFDPQSNIADLTRSTPNDDDTAILLIELAPITEMPATVYWFLEQINATIYNGAAFHRNAHHVVQGGIIANFVTKTGDIHRINELIRTTGLDSIPFQE